MLDLYEYGVQKVNSTRHLFTLTELLTVITIFCLIAGILLPALAVPVNRAKQLACSNNLRYIGQCVTFYSTDNSGYIPNTVPGKDHNSTPLLRNSSNTTLALGKLIECYTVNAEIFGCPDSPGYTAEDVENAWQSAVNVCSAYLYRSQCGDFNNRLYAAGNLNKAYVMDLACITPCGEEFAPHDYQMINLLFPDCHTESRRNTREPFRYFTIQTSYNKEDSLPGSIILWQHADSQM